MLCLFFDASWIDASLLAKMTSIMETSKQSDLVMIIEDTLEALLQAQMKVKVFSANTFCRMYRLKKTRTKPKYCVFKN